MSRRARWFGTAGLLVALTILAGSVAVARLDPSDYKQMLIDAVQDATGRTLSLNGPLRVSRSLWPTLEVTDVTFANLPGGTRPDMARAERIEATLSLPSLLRHRIEVTRLLLVGPNILFEQVGGKPNWLFEPSGRVATVPTSRTLSTPFQFRICTSHVQNGMVTWRLPARTKVVGIRSLDVRHPTDDGSLEADSILVYSDNQPFRFDARATPPAGFAGPWLTQLNFAAYDTTVAATGTMDVAGHYDLQVEAKVGALAKLNALLPEMQLPAVSQATVSAHLTNGKRPGDLPVIGTTSLQFADADLGTKVRGLKLGSTEVRLADAEAQATLASSGHFRAQAFTVAGSLSMPRYPDERVTLPFDIKLWTAPGNRDAAGNLGLKGKLTLDALHFAGLDTAAALNLPVMAAWRQAVTQSLPALTGVTFDGHLVVPADAGFVRFSNAKLITREGDVAGDGTLALGTTVALDAKLQSSQLDLDAILEAFGIDLNASAARASPLGPVIPDIPLLWNILRGPAIHLSLATRRVTFMEQVWAALNLELQLKGGRLHVASAEQPDALLAFSFTADASGATVPVSLSVQTPALPLAIMARHAGLRGPVRGSAVVDAQLRGTGNSTRTLVASLDGSFLMKALNGQISNDAFRTLTSAALDSLGIKVPAEGITAIRCLGLAGSLSKGVALFRTVALETTYLSVEGVGQVDLGRETVAFKLRPLAQVSGSSVAVPVVVEGRFRALSGRLDAGPLEKLGFLLNAWSGGDEATACRDAGLVPSLPTSR